MQWETDDGELYTLQNGSSGTIIYVVQVNTTVTATNVLYATATASVSRGPINASCNSIVINLMGMTVDPNQNNIDSILISHQCMASMFIMTPFTSIVNLKWTVNGDTFDSFFISADQTIGHVVYCNPTNWSSSYPQWCWWDTGGAGAVNGDGTISVSCDVFVNGNKIGPITDTRPVNLWAPFSKLKYTIPTPISTVFTKGDDGNGPQSGGKASNKDGDDGILFKGFCGTQDLFRQTALDPLAEWGQFCFVQILTLNRNKTSSIGYIDNLTINNALDGSFPYNVDYPANNTTDNEVSGYNTPGKAVDSPESGFIKMVTSFNITDTYKMYMMYHAPGNSQWVPIQSNTWHWNTGRLPPCR